MGATDLGWYEWVSQPRPPFAGSILISDCAPALPAISREAHKREAGS
jgi:hypothetical protein